MRRIPDEIAARLVEEYLPDRPLLVEVPDPVANVRTMYRTKGEADLTASERALIAERLGLAAYLAYPAV